MSLKHLSLQEIDSYVYGNQDDRFKDTFIQHLNTCELCRNKVTEYQSILSELDDMDGFNLNRNFSQDFLSKLPDSYPQREKPFLEIFSIAAASIIIICTIYLFIDEPMNLFSALSNEVKTLTQTASNIVKQLQVSQKGNIFLLFIFNAAGFRALDSIFSRGRMKRKLRTCYRSNPS